MHIQLMLITIIISSRKSATSNYVRISPKYTVNNFLLGTIFSFKLNKILSNYFINKIDKLYYKTL